MFLALLLFTSMSVAAPVECDLELQSEKAPARLTFSPVERQISENLKSFFAAEPKARMKFLTEYYGSDFTAVNSLLENALNILPAGKRDELVRTAHAKNESLFASAAAELAASGKLNFLLEQPGMKTSELQTLSKAAAAAGLIVTDLEDGAGDFTVISDPRTGYVRYFSIISFRNATPLTAAQFIRAIQWRRRDATVWARLNPWPKRDILQAEVNQLPFPENFRWRYGLNNLSDETYAAALALMKTGHRFNFGSAPHLESNLSDQIWRAARANGITVKFDDKEYDPSELTNIQHAFHLRGFINEGYDKGERVYEIEGREIYFRKMRNARGQIIFRQEERPAAASPGSTGEALSKSLSTAIAPGAALNRFPAQPIEIPLPVVPQLNRILNPGGASLSGFKLASENLNELIAQDTATVQSRGHTHKTLADWLSRAIDTIDSGRSPIIKIDGRDYAVAVNGSRGFQFSPFGSRVKWSANFVMLDLTTGRRIEFSGGHPYMIGWYGFFEGRVPLRLDPAALIDMMEQK